MWKTKHICGFLLILLLAGCKSQLYTGLTEREGNDMLAMLLESGIEATKELNKDRELTLFVPDKDVAKAIQLLRSNGYPRDKFSSIGDIFPKEGLISSPTEEKARYTYSMSQELSATLSMIDGVITARVHVVLPQEKNGVENTYPSSASVFIKYSPELILTGFIPKVKTLVSNSIEGLSLDKITVTLFPSDKVSMSGSEYAGNESSLDKILSVEVASESKGRLMLLLIGLGGLLILALGALGFLGWILWRKRKPSTDKNKIFPEDEKFEVISGDEEVV